MFAQRFFKEQDLIDLEDLLFKGSTKRDPVRYALINEAQGVYYLSVTVVVPDLVSRTRHAINGPEYQLLAWNIQRKIAHTSLSSWTLVCFKNHVPDSLIHDVMRSYGIRKVVKAKAYEINDFSNLRIYKAQHIRNGLTMWYSSACGDPNMASRYIKKNLNALSKEYSQEQAQKLLGIANVTYSKEWVITQEIKPRVMNLRATRTEVLSYCRQSIDEWLSKKG